MRRLSVAVRGVIRIGCAVIFALVLLAGTAPPADARGSTFTITLTIRGPVPDDVGFGLAIGGLGEGPFCVSRAERAQQAADAPRGTRLDPVCRSGVTYTMTVRLGKGESNRLGYGIGIYWPHRGEWLWTGSLTGDGRNHRLDYTYVFGLPATDAIAEDTGAAPVSGHQLAASGTSWEPIPRSATSADDVRMAPAPDGRLFAVVRGKDASTVVGFNRRGRILDGWPRTLTGWTDCWIGTVSRDGSVRLVCRNGGDSVRAFAFSATGRRLAGWPVDVTGAAGRRFNDYDHVVMEGDVPRITGSRLDILLQRWDGGAAVRLVRITAAGEITVGTKFVYPVADCDADWRRALGADGAAYVVRYSLADWECPGDDSSEIFAVGLDGVRAGWPVTVKGLASIPIVGPHGRAYVVLERTRTAARVRVFERDGLRVDGWSPRIPVLATSAWGGAGGFSPAPPVVAENGSAWLISGAGGTAAWALRSTGSLRDGWPYRSRAELSEQGLCDRCSTGCGSLRVEPVAGPTGVLYVAQEPQSSTIGGRIIALSRDGTVRPGWPIYLVRHGSRFRSLAVGADGTVYGLAIELERQVRRDGCLVDVNSATIVAFAPDGTVRYRRTVMAP